MTPQTEIHAAAENRAQPVAGVDVGVSQPVQAHQRVNEEGRAFAAKGQARADRCGIDGSVVVLVDAVVGFESQVTGEVVIHAGATALSDVAHLHSDRRIEGLEWRGHSDAWMQPLIAEEEFYFRGRFVLCRCRSRY